MLEELKVIISIPTCAKLDEEEGSSLAIKCKRLNLFLGQSRGV
jgi:hypothetical protein